MTEDIFSIWSEIIVLNISEGNKVSVTFRYAQVLRFVTTTCHVELTEKLKLHIEYVLIN